VRADNLARELGVRSLWVKNDAVNYPTLSFKDRVVSVALSKARELGFKTVGCASTGNLANSVAANAAASGLEAYILVPSDLERSKILGTSIYGAKLVGVRGTYDQVNRLCTQIAVKNNREQHRPVRKPNTIAKSLAIGDPADGYFAAQVIRGSGGWAEDASDAEISEAMVLLGRTEGIFAETAGGVTVTVARKLIEQGR